MWQEGGSERVLAVVPARGGSKGIPRKNLQTVAGHSLVAWTAATIRALPWIDYALLSTDDEEIAAEGRRVGLAVPFLRPAALATDAATAVDTWRHAWLAAEAERGVVFPLSVYLQPTTPLRRPEEVERTLRRLVEGGHKAATTVARVPGHFVPEKILRLDRGGRLRFFVADGGRHSNRQTAAAYYYRTGACYAARRATVVEQGTIVEDDCAGVVTEGVTVNIDDPIDLRLANLLAGEGGP